MNELLDSSKDALTVPPIAYMLGKTPRLVTTVPALLLSIHKYLTILYTIPETSDRLALMFGSFDCYPG